ncbi:MAG: hypothetical protein AB1861_13970 [Cyanobacteriota bacterium]
MQLDKKRLPLGCDRAHAKRGVSLALKESVRAGKEQSVDWC